MAFRIKWKFLNPVHILTPTCRNRNRDTYSVKVPAGELHSERTCKRPVKMVEGSQVTKRDDSTINRTLRRKWKLVVQTILEGNEMRLV